MRLTTLHTHPNMGYAAMIGVLLILVAFQPGCSSQPTVTDLRANSSDYDNAFDAVLAAVREAGYTIDRVDRRHGVITSKPLSAGSVLEPWRDPQASPEQAIESTFNYERRLIRVYFEPMAAVENNQVPTNQSGQGTNLVVAQVEKPTSGWTDISQYQGSLRIDVQCTIERSHRPGRRIETRSSRRLSYTTDPALAKQGIPGDYWEPASRDAYTEQFMMKLITQQAEGFVHVETLEPLDSSISDS